MEGESEVRKSRKEKRKEMKKTKRKVLRKEMAEKERQEEERRLNDPEELKRLKEMGQQEAERMQKEREEFEERERQWITEMMEKKRIREEEEEEAAAAQMLTQDEMQNGCNEDDDWEYMDEGPAEIIWQGNEIIVKKKKVRVSKKNTVDQIKSEDVDRPTSNPLPPESEAFAEYQDGSMLSSQQMLENVAQRVPNFGTEQDKAHCPFHLKTGVCRFGQRCSRVHFYPDKSCTLLFKNMYNGPGLAWEQDEGLEYTDEEVEHCYEEFYDDVHTEFLKYGEIVNFKVCRNGSFHLRGNVYVHYKYLDAAVLAYQSFNGRYFAGKQVTCEFVNLTKWKVAICGEFMKSKLTTCSRGSACNFIHCFRNPGGDYEWADWDKPPPRYWVRKMVALFGYSDESVHEKHVEQEKLRRLRIPRKGMPENTNRHHSRRSRSRDVDHFGSLDNDDFREGAWLRSRADGGGIGTRIIEDKLSEDNSSIKDNDHTERKKHDSSSDGECSDSCMNKNTERCRHHDIARKISKHKRSCSNDYHNCKSWFHNIDLDEERLDGERNRKLHYNSSTNSARKQKSQLLEDSCDSRNEAHGIDQLDRDSDREKNHSKLERSSRCQGKARNHDHLEDGESRMLDTGSTDKCLIGEKDADRHHHRRKSSERQNQASEDRYHYRRKSSERQRKVLEVQDDGWDVGHDSLTRDEGKYHCRRREHRMDDESEFSEDVGKNANRVKENSSGGEFENRRFLLKRKSSGSYSSGRNRSSRKRGETNSLVDSMRQNGSQELGHAYPSDGRIASHDSDLKYNIGVEIDELDRWQPERSE